MKESIEAYRQEGKDHDPCLIREQRQTKPGV
jgi:hypothetical protein